MGDDNTVIGFRFCPPDCIVEEFRTIAVEGAGLVPCGGLGRRIGIEQDDLRIQDGDPEVPDRKDHRTLGIRLGLAGADIGDAFLIQGVQGIQKPFFPVVVGVVVSQGHEICAHICENVDMLRIRAEIVLLGDSGAAGGPGKFIVHHKKIRPAHQGEGLFVKAALRAPLCQRSARRVAGIHQDITGEGDGVGAVGCIRCIGGPGSDVGLLSEGFCDDVDHRPLVS